MLHKTRGIVLHQIKYTDYSRIVHFYTEHFGRLSCLVRIARKKHAANPVGLLHPLSLVEMELYYRSSRELQHVKEIRSSIVFTTIPFDVKKETVALFLGEVMYRTLREEESNPGLFDFLYNAIHFFDTTEEGIVYFHLYFLLHLTRFLGFFPVNNWSETNPFFDLQNGIFVAGIPAHGKYLDEEDSRLLNQLMSASMSHLSQRKWLAGQRNGLLHHLLSFYRFHIESFGEIKSLPVISDIFH